MVLVPKVSGTGTHSQKGVGTGTDQSGTSTDASSNLVFVPLALFRDPNKGLMYKSIRERKRTVPFRLDDIRLVRLIVQPLRVENLYLTRCG